MTVLATSEEQNGRHAAANERRVPPAKWVLAGLFALLALPIVVAVAVLHSPRWYPLLDWAQTEIRVRDVWSSHPPLIGLAGRIGPFGPDGGSHPGPVSFYALWPAWRLLGASSYGLQVGNGLLDLGAIALVLWMAYRRGGVVMALSIGAVLAVVMRAYGAFMLTLPWNPYLPVLWWFVFLMAVWSILDDDTAMLPLAAFASVFTMQTHISYLGLVGGLTVFAAAVAVVRASRRRSDPGARRSFAVWGLVALAMLVVFWTPPVVDQVVHSPGNLETIEKHFSDPPESPIGFGEGTKVLLTQLNPFSLFGSTLVSSPNPQPVSGSPLPGLGLACFWAASVYVAWRLRERLLLKLDVVLAVALTLGWISAARIFGDVWFYLLLWAWALTGLMLFAIIWTAVEWTRRHAGDRYAVRGIAALVTFLVVVTGMFAFSAAYTKVMSPRLNEQLAALVPPTLARMEALKDEGFRGPYLVTWLPEAQAIGAEGYGLQNELLRHGFDARAAFAFRPGSTRYHVMDPSVATIQIHLATGVDIACWRDDSRYQQVAYQDPRSAAERVEFERLHADVLAELRREGLPTDLDRQVDGNLFMLALSQSVPASTRKLMAKMLDLGMPAAVFIGPPGDRPHSARPECRQL